MNKRISYLLLSSTLSLTMATTAYIGQTKGLSDTTIHDVKAMTKEKQVVVDDTLQIQSNFRQYILLDGYVTRMKASKVDKNIKKQKTSLEESKNLPFKGVYSKGLLYNSKGELRNITYKGTKLSVRGGLVFVNNRPYTGTFQTAKDSGYKKYATTYKNRTYSVNTFTNIVIKRNEKEMKNRLEEQYFVKGKYIKTYKWG